MTAQAPQAAATQVRLVILGSNEAKAGLLNLCSNLWTSQGECWLPACAARASAAVGSGVGSGS